MVSPRLGAVVRHLTEEPETAAALVERLDDEALANLAASLTDEVRRRALAAGDRDAIIAARRGEPAHPGAVAPPRLLNRIGDAT